MDTEQLKMILELASQAGDGAQQIALLYLGVKILQPLAIILPLAWMVKIIASHIMDGVIAAQMERQGWESVCENLDLGYSYKSNPTHSQIADVVSRIRKAGCK